MYCNENCYFSPQILRELKMGKKQRTSTQWLVLNLAVPRARAESRCRLMQTTMLWYLKSQIIRKLLPTFSREYGILQLVNDEQMNSLCLTLAFCSGNTKMCSVCVCVCVLVKCLCQIYRNTECCTTMLSSQIYFTENNANYAYQFLKEIWFQLICTKSNFTYEYNIQGEA